MELKIFTGDKGGDLASLIPGELTGPIMKGRADLIVDHMISIVDGSANHEVYENAHAVIKVLGAIIAMKDEEIKSLRDMVPEIKKELKKIRADYAGQKCLFGGFIEPPEEGDSDEAT